MSDEVVIKKVERETIILEECFVGEFSPLYTLIWFLVLFGFTYGVGIIFINLLGDPNNAVSQLPALSVFMSIFFTLFLGGLGGCSKSLPAYEVRIVGQYGGDCRRMVIKTTPERDQVEICRATQELESKARAISKKERDLEQIAMKCK